MGRARHDATGSDGLTLQKFDGRVTGWLGAGVGVCTRMVDTLDGRDGVMVTLGVLDEMGDGCHVDDGATGTLEPLGGLGTKTP